jgi:hypothetical protein
MVTALAFAGNLVDNNRRGGFSKRPIVVIREGGVHTYGPPLQKRSVLFQEFHMRRSPILLAIVRLFFTPVTAPDLNRMRFLFFTRFPFPGSN